MNCEDFGAVFMLGWIAGGACVAFVVFLSKDGLWRWAYKKGMIAGRLDPFGQEDVPNQDTH